MLFDDIPLNMHQPLRVLIELDVARVLEATRPQLLSMHICDKVEGGLVDLRDLNWRQNLTSAPMEILEHLLNVIIERTMDLSHHVNLLWLQQHHQIVEVLIDLARGVI